MVVLGGGSIQARTLVTSQPPSPPKPGAAFGSRENPSPVSVCREIDIFERLAHVLLLNFGIAGLVQASTQLRN